MKPCLIVVPEVPAKRLFQVVSVLEGGEVNALVFDAAPESLHEDIVMVAALAVHADPDAMFFESAYKGLAGELRTLIGIEDFWRSMALKSLFQGIDTEIGVHGV